MTIQLKSIKGFDSFSKIYQMGRKFHSKNASAVVIFSDISINSGEKHTIFYGVSVGKKIARKAVVRNRIKRLMRESLRIIINDNVNNFIFIDNIILTYRYAPTHKHLIDLQDVLPAIKNILEQANFYYNKHN